MSVMAKKKAPPIVLGFLVHFINIASIPVKRAVECLKIVLMAHRKCLIGVEIDLITPNARKWSYNVHLSTS